MATRAVDVVGSGTLGPEVAARDDARAAAPPAGQGRTGHFLRRALLWVAHEPFFQFIALGSLLFLGSQYLEQRSSVPHIRVGSREIKGITNNYRLQYGASPTAAELNSLIERYVQEEIFYREALRLKLDENDEIVRRRLVQKYEFLQQDLASAQPPSEQDLRVFYDAHRDNYRIPARLSFSQVFFSVDRAGDEDARARAERALAVLRQSRVTRAPELGDSFPGETDYAGVTLTQVRRAFGSSELSDEIFSLPPDSWAGPLRSGLGWHLVHVGSIEPAGLARFEDVRDRVERDYLEDSRKAHEARAYARLKQRYHIDREQGP